MASCFCYNPLPTTIEKSASFFVLLFSSLLHRLKLLPMWSTLVNSHLNNFLMILLRYALNEINLSYLKFYVEIWVVQNRCLYWYICRGSWSVIVIHQRKSDFLMMFWVLILYSCLYMNKWIDLLVLAFMSNLIMTALILFFSSYVCPSSPRAWACCCSSNYFVYHWWYAGVW